MSEHPLNYYLRRALPWARDRNKDLVELARWSRTNLGIETDQGGLLAEMQERLDQACAETGLGTAQYRLWPHFVLLVGSAEAAIAFIDQFKRVVDALSEGGMREQMEAACARIRIEALADIEADSKGLAPAEQYDRELPYGGGLN